MSLIVRGSKVQGCGYRQLTQVGRDGEDHAHGQVCERRLFDLSYDSVLSK